MRVKICGITNVEDAELAVELGAWAVGMVMHPRSIRRCELAAAVEIGAVLKRRCEVVGVFVNEPLDHVVSVAEECGLTMLQLHGDEGPMYCAQVSRRTGAKVIKAVRVRDRLSILRLIPFPVDYLLLDTFAKGQPGGTGKTFDWALVKGRRFRHPIILSGGLDPDNVEEAVETVAPYCVDVASGVEDRPGRKDPARLTAFFRAANRAGAAIEAEAAGTIEPHEPHEPLSEAPRG